MDDQLKYLNELTWSYRASRVLQIAVKIRLFTALSGNEYSTERLAELCSAKSDMLQKLLIACCAMGFVKRANGLYQNSDLAENYLVEGKPLYQGDIISHAANVWDFWNDLPDQISTNPLPKDETQSHKNFILGMKNITLGGRGKIFTDNIDLSGKKRMLDVGGGPGTYSILACQKYPELTAAVFDLPPTVAIAQDEIKQAGLQDRILTIPGNWETDNLGSGYDVVLFSNVLHGGKTPTLMKLRKAYESMEPNGMVVIQEFLLNNKKTGPLVPALFNIMVGAFSEQEIKDVILNAGFKFPELVADNQQIGCTWITAVK